jgi:hypothetical protein
MSINNIKSILKIANQEADRMEADLNISQEQIIYLSDKLSKVFHSLRRFNETHGRDLDPEALDEFNAAWRNYEASFDTWQSYQKKDSNFSLDNTFDLE